MVPITTMVYVFITSVIFLANPSDFHISNSNPQTTTTTTTHRILPDYGSVFVHPDIFVADIWRHIFIDVSSDSNYSS
ncbi:hypothetical protein vseg_008865 [Gypsophila vaccaria]